MLNIRCIWGVERYWNNTPPEDSFLINQSLHKGNFEGKKIICSTIIHLTCRKLRKINLPKVVLRLNPSCKNSVVSK